MNSQRSHFSKLLPGAAILAAVLAVPAGALAQSSADDASYSGRRAVDADNKRFLQIFEYDAAVVENFWIEGQARLTDDPDGIGLGTIFAWSPVDRLEVGARIGWADQDNVDNGLTDMPVYAKWQFFHNPVEFTAGIELSLPTGAEDDLLNPRLATGEVDMALFASVRKNLEQAYVTGYFGLRVNQDADIGSLTLDGDTSIFLGGGVMFPINDVFSLSGELRVETERYNTSLQYYGDSFIDLTAGAFWYATEKSSLRAGLSLGLEDGAPDWELTAGYAWTF